MITNGNVRWIARKRTCDKLGGSLVLARGLFDECDLCKPLGLFGRPVGLQDDLVEFVNECRGSLCAFEQTDEFLSNLTRLRTCGDRPAIKALCVPELFGFVRNGRPFNPSANGFFGLGVKEELLS